MLDPLGPRAGPALVTAGAASTERLLVNLGPVFLALELELLEQVAQVGPSDALENQAEDASGELGPTLEATGGPGAPPAR